MYFNVLKTLTLKNNYIIKPFHRNAAVKTNSKFKPNSICYSFYRDKNYYILSIIGGLIGLIVGLFTQTSSVVTNSSSRLRSFDWFIAQFATLPFCNLIPLTPCHYPYPCVSCFVTRTYSVVFDLPHPI